MDYGNQKGSKLDQAIAMLGQCLMLLQDYQEEENGEPQDQEDQSHGLAGMMNKGEQG